MELKAARIVYYFACETEADVRLVESKLTDAILSLVPQVKAHELQLQKVINIKVPATKSFGIWWLNRTIGHMIRRLSKGGPRTRAIALPD